MYQETSLAKQDFPDRAPKSKSKTQEKKKGTKKGTKKGQNTMVESKNIAQGV